ncbi:MAG: hypothetical protein JNK20_13660 [Flavipsychrobacter sp.]|nr:hypothetical protein [Flavipsychrobacter sp.]
MNRLAYCSFLLILMQIYACVSLKPPTSIKYQSIENFKYIFLSTTNSLTSSTGVTISGQYYSSSKSVNPSDVITGILTKNGFIKLAELNTELLGQTLIVNYGESGKRKAGLGYTIEVTIQFISAKSNTLVASCTAEGQGETEADDIRQAITRCLNEIISKNK